MDNMKFTQSTLQGFINRLITSYRTIIPVVVVPIVLSIVLKLNGQPLPKEMVTILLLVPIFVTLWLMVFNSGTNKLQACELTLNERFISVSKYGEKSELNWNDITKLTISKFVGNHVILSSNSEQELMFDYFAFSKKQRDQIISYIKSKITN
ncbi:hypothetical protein [Pleionea litopenaei]|uniref:Uncharacterized protein n=1 Tax=Pleionea litopenaei TaxID=3070815 RepID=A0AA51RS07_9GAMM|nr:hypothetical protein [Pleionea sp. HL-JVS1]WMS86577.1 hypothetical protein Q9312_15255 [Pleionea sp. HL-JVS1]